MSIGENCCAAELLDGLKWRSETYLFDWARSNLKMVAEVLVRGPEWHIETNLVEMPPAYHGEGVHWKRLNYPHHPFPTKRDWMIRSAFRFFDVLAHADDLVLIHCAPRPIDRSLLLAVEEAVQARRKSLPFRIVALHGETGPLPYGVVSSEALSDRTALHSIRADKEFVNNKMRGPHYEDLARLLVGAPESLYVTGENDA